MKITGINKTVYNWSDDNKLIFLVWTNEPFCKRGKMTFHSFMSLESIKDWLDEHKIYNKKQAFNMLAEVKESLCLTYHK